MIFSANKIFQVLLYLNVHMYVQSKQGKCPCSPAYMHVSSYTGAQNFFPSPDTHTYLQEHTQTQCKCLAFTGFSTNSINCSTVHGSVNTSCSLQHYFFSQNVIV